MKTRGFEVVSRLDGQDIKLPERSTKFSAGYDFFAYEDVVIPSSTVPDFLQVTRDLITGGPKLEMGRVKPTLVKTGIKAYMQEDEALILANRSSNPKKLGLILGNGIGLIDSDYYDSSDNEGEICFMYFNIFPIPIQIKKGDKIGQGFFQKILIADNDNASGIREGGFGSTGK